MTKKSFTFYARVGSLEMWRYVGRTRFCLVQFVVIHVQGTTGTSRAFIIHNTENIHDTAQISEVYLDAFTERHSSVSGHLHHDHFVRFTSCIESFSVAVF